MFEFLMSQDLTLAQAHVIVGLALTFAYWIKE